MDNFPDNDIKYTKFYQPDDTYWGLGIENEIYFILANPINKTGTYIKKNRKRERYSVDYTDSYDQEKLLTYLNKVFLDNDIYKIPQYANSHTITKTDSTGEHVTLYVVGKKYNPKFNPKFNGKTLNDLLHETDEMFKKDFEHGYVFDGGYH